MRPALPSSAPAAVRRSAPEGQLLAVHAAHPLQAPVRGEDEDAALHEAGQPGGGRPDREGFKLGSLKEMAINVKINHQLIYVSTNSQACAIMTSLLTRALLVLVCGFAALSSSVAAALGLAEERVLVFTALLLALLLLPFVLRPHLSPAEQAGPPAVRAPGGDRGDRPRRQLRVRRRQDCPAGAGAAGGAEPRPSSASGRAGLRFAWRLLSGYVALDLPLPGGWRSRPSSPVVTRASCATTPLAPS